MDCNNRLSKNKWDDIPYNKDKWPPIGEVPGGGGLPLYYFKRIGCNKFTDLYGNPIGFDIKEPEESDGFSTFQLEDVLKKSKNLSPHEKKSAIYWGKGSPQNQLIPMLQALINYYGVSAVTATRLYAVLCTALNDAMVIAWHFKYQYQIPRPNQYNQCFEPFLKTPYHPSYPSGHSVFAGCTEVILAHFFPKECDKIKERCNECSISRFWGGVHYVMDLTEGYKLGKDIGYKVLKYISGESDCNGATANIKYDIYRDAKLDPPPYEQVFNFKDDICDYC